jgi:hypothetical protein
MLPQKLDFLDSFIQRYEFPRSSLRVSMKSEGSLEPSARRMVCRVLGK